MIIPFGRHRGKLVSELSDSYLLWLSNLDLHGQLQLAVDRELRLREEAWRRRCEELRERLGLGEVA